MSGGDQKDDAEALNRVHDDQNWRQRIEAEIQATEDWHQFYGFLAADAEVDPAVKEEMLKRARRGPLHEFIVAHHKAHGGSDKDAPLALEKETADQMRSYVKHGLGWSLCRPGIPPVQKYSTPITTSQTVGWMAAKYGPLERLVAGDDDGGEGKPHT
ncbi:Uncharacterized protein PBTT_10469 [Plasmodiophora brassicae]|uniref:Uncharacterized protein n=1 Tax=Plasmodiophora brassicae TaxID=37360 RepID=A0A0G4IXI1_PLABS|nr:hypothetical protein PBRA_007558 [Plasmodiophora brassicae]SPR02086.1 unnamed protein product [Plasmodiophora brassicae]